MDRLDERIKLFLTAFDLWINQKSGKLDEAIRQAREVYTLSDIQHRLEHFRQKLTIEVLEDWVARCYRTVTPQTCLCLHAGNLPMVGFQDLLAVWLSGHTYIGKLSKRDPWLMQSFLQVLQTHTDASEVQWSTRLEWLPQLPVDRVLFSGSGSTIPQVEQALAASGMISSQTQWLIRVASFSIAWLPNPSTADLQDLAEAILRYRGSGCRSVKVVITDAIFKTWQHRIKKVFEAWWISNDVLSQATAHTLRDYAYEKAIEREHVLLGAYLITGDSELNQNPDRILWLQGGEQTVAQYYARYRASIQSVYTSDPNHCLLLPDLHMEPLYKAQDPEISWKADGVEVLHWLTSEFM